MEQFGDNPKDKWQLRPKSPLMNAEDLWSNWKPGHEIMFQTRETTVLQQATYSGNKLPLRLCELDWRAPLCPTWRCSEIDDNKSLTMAKYTKIYIPAAMSSRVQSRRPFKKLQSESSMNPNANSEIQVTLLLCYNGNRPTIWRSYRQSNEFPKQGDGRVRLVKANQEVCRDTHRQVNQEVLPTSENYAGRHVYQVDKDSTEAPYRECNH